MSRKINIEADSLKKIYKNREVVKSVSLSMEKGEVVGLLGPNGAGKTTTFYMITGIVKPNNGRVLYNGEDITNFPMYKRARLGLGYLPQEASVFRNLTVEENIVSVLEMRGIPKKERMETMNNLIEEFKLSHVAKSLGYYVGDNVGRVFTFSISWLKSVFIGVDVYLNSLEEKIGTAVVHSLTSAYLINVGINIVDTMLTTLSTSFFANPFLTHPILTPIVVGLGIGHYLDEAYRENRYGVKDTINNIGEYITNSIDNVGQTISSTLNHLKFSFGW